MNDKKGISPLIATVLIVGFTIVLAVLVITWISGTVNDQTNLADCQADVGNICLAAVGSVTGGFAAATTVFTVTNQGSTGYDDVNVVFLDGAGSTVAGPLPVAVTQLGAFSSTAVDYGAALPFKARIITTVSSDVGEGCKMDCAAIEITK
ncbi:hypothetical protein J4438_02185 [Candidatus Woesearchaeota archaeon]|nr:hypothetical protein [Candidatus Woesearchaeota archaeon]